MMEKEQHKRRKEGNKSEQSGNLPARHEEDTKIFITGKLAASIDDIARRANLISLMAAVEAGRAGKEQTGLSAMAGKTRYLAIKSAEAVSETRTHVEHAVTIVERIHDISQMKMASHRENRGVA